MPGDREPESQPTSSRRDFVLRALAAPAVGFPLAASRAGAVPAPAAAPASVSPDEWNRTKTTSASAKTALVLSGGLALGAYEAGVVKALHERGYRFDLICGTSMGALNGAMLAQQDVEALEALWRSIASRHIKKLDGHVQVIVDAYQAYMRRDVGVLTRFVRGSRFFRHANDLGALSKLFGMYDPAATKDLLTALDLRKLVTPLAFPVTNVDRGESHALYAAPTGNDPGPRDALFAFSPLHPHDRSHVALYPEAVRASAAFPIAFAPVPLPGIGASGDVENPDRFADGGITNNTPLRLARALGATSVMTVFLGPKVEPARRAANLLEALANMYAANQNQLIANEIQLTLDARPAAPGLSSTAVFEIRPATPLDIRPMDFDEQTLVDRAFARGLTDGADRANPKRVHLTESG